MPIAHRNPHTKQEQLLIDHLFNVAELAADSAQSLNLSNTVYLLGILHDLGKSDRSFFIDKLRNNPNKKVNHSSAGGLFFCNFLASYLKDNSEFAKKIMQDPEKLNVFLDFREVITYIITAHHGLYDIWRPNSLENHMLTRLNYIKTEKYNYEKDILPFTKEIEKELKKRKNMTFEELILSSLTEYTTLVQKLKTPNNVEQTFYTNLTIRLLLSFLKNADIEDTINAYETRIEPFDKQTLRHKKRKYLHAIENIYGGFSKPTTKINQIRTRLGEESLHRGRVDGPGIYQLNLPTGAGKTLISLRYGMHQLNSQHKDRFIYITPFLSVLEQNAAEIKDILNDSDIVEHHSNIIKEENPHHDEEDLFEQYLIDSWNSPVVLSTMVQFFQTLFKGKSSNIRRFSSLAHSVIVLDEVQSLPVTTTHLFNLTMNFLSRIMKSTIVLCTATQPPYDSTYIKHKMKYGGLNKEPENIVELTPSDRKVFDRTEVNLLENNQKNIDALDITEEVLKYPEESILIILNTKNAVEEVFNELSSQTDRSLYYLTTNLCPKHRQEVITEIKEKLNKKEPVICVSTQLIEAGVDIDFQRLIRSYAGIDSIIQSIGRCNRHGSLAQKGQVKLAKVSKKLENTKNIKEIHNKIKATSQILEDAPSPLDIDSLNNYFYESYYANNQNEMDFPLLNLNNSPSGLELLSTNENAYDSSRKGYFGRLNQSFQTAAKNIDLIQSETTGVIVYYKESEQLINELIELMNEPYAQVNPKTLEKIKYYSKKLQPYTVNMYITHEVRPYITSYLKETIHILQQDYYDAHQGVNIQTSKSFIF